VKPFQFQSVLNYRRRLEDKARKNLMRVLREEEEILARRKQAAAELDELYNRQLIRRQEGVTIDHFLQTDARKAVIREQLNLCDEQLAKVREKVRLRRNGLLKAGQDKRALEKLKEKQNRAYRQYLQKKEAILLDETAILFHGREP